MGIRRMLVQVCSKEVEVAPSIMKTVYYGFRKEFNEQTQNYIDVVTPTVDKDGKPLMRAVSFKVKFTDYAKEHYLIDKENCLLKFPVILDVDLDAVLEDDADKPDNEQRHYAFITKDRDSTTKKVRLDRNGKSHLVLVINKVHSFIEVGKTDYSFDDIDTIECA